MNPPDQRPAQAGNPTEARGLTLRLVLSYAAFASVWILFSDQALEWLFQNPTEIVFVSTLKGWLFVGVTSLLLYGLVRRLLERTLALSRRELDPVPARRRPVLHEMAEVASSAGPLAIGLCFGGYACCRCAVIGFLPTLQVERLGFSTSTAAVVTASMVRTTNKGLTATASVVTATLSAARTFMKTLSAIAGASAAAPNVIIVSGRIAVRIKGIIYELIE